MRTGTRWLIVVAVGLASLFGGIQAANAATPMISMGGKHALALRSDGTVVAWGSDEYGQLGIGRALYSAVPIKVHGLNSVRTIASGGSHVLAVKQDGSVWAWGSNVAGQLGDGSTTDRTSPVQIPAMTTVLMVAGGYSHSIALKRDGTVWAWGWNTFGQLGVGNAPDGSASPLQVAGLNGVIAIAAGFGHNIALRQDGTVWTWGRNDYGQLGDGTINDRDTDRNVPMQVSGLTDVVAIAAGWYTSTALRRDGTVWEWGLGVAQGVNINRATPVQSAGISGVVSLGTGGAFIAVVRADGSAWFWRPGEAPTPAPGTLQPVATGISRATVAGYHTLLLKTDQTVLGFGMNNYGQVGDGTTSTTWRYRPVPVVGLSSIIALAGGYDHSVALDANGEVWTWGADAFGQLGRGAVTNQSVPVQVPQLEGVAYVSAGWYHSLAIKEDGTVWAWGRNITGLLGDGTDTDRSAPVPVSGITNVRLVTGGLQHSLALQSDGTLWAWGSNYLGQIGDGTNNDSRVPIMVPGMAGVIAIAATSQSMAVKRDGTVWAWGRNEEGQLGLGTVTPIGPSGTTTDNNRPIRVPGLTNILTVATSLRSSYAVGADGTAWAWGWGGYGVLGDGGPTNRLTPVPVSGLEQAAVISAGERYALAYRHDGSVWGWGLAYDVAPLGDRAVTTPTVTPMPLTKLKRITQVSASRNFAPAFSAFLREDGTVNTAGDNPSGQLGDGTLARRPSPVLVVGPSADGFLNLYVGQSVDVPPEFRVPFFVVAAGGITDTSATVGTTTKFNLADQGKPGAVFVTARVPAGSLRPRVQALADAEEAARRQAARVAPAAGDASGFELMQLTASGWQPVVNSQLLPYASGVLGDQLAAQTILDGTDTTNLKGGQFCVGYGTSAAEMAAAGRMREVATIPAPAATGVSLDSCVVAGNVSPGASYALTVSKAGTGVGTVTSSPPGIACGSDCTETYAGNTTVTLTATAGANAPGGVYTFGGWGGACSGFGAQSTCTLTISAAQSASATFNYSAAGSTYSRDYVQKAYFAYYGRPADPAGQGYWAQRMDAEGQSLSAIIGAFGSSAEYAGRYGGLTPADLVTKIYQQALARAPDRGGLDYYVGELQAGRRTLQTITLDVLNGANGPPDATVVANKLDVATYYTAQVAAGCAYGSEQDGVNALAGVSAISSTVPTAKAAIDSRCELTTRSGARLKAEAWHRDPVHSP